MYGHDGAGNLTWSAQGLSSKTGCVNEANAGATKVSRSYDARSRLTSIDYPTGTADESLAYYPDGKLHTATRAANGSPPQSIWTLLYNHRRLPTDETLTMDAKTFHIGYGYDSEGQRSSTQYPSGLQIAWAPDGLGRPTQASGYASAITYAPDGTLTGLSYGNATTLARTLNTRELILTTTYALGGTAVSQRTLGYDENGNLSGIGDSVAGCAVSDTIFCNGFEGTPLAGTDSRTYAYDAIDRLTQMTSGRYGVDAYTYDPLGNVRTNGATAWHYNAATNRVSDENGTAYGYDARGNVTSIGSFAPTWNLANEQVADSLGGGYAYDARGWRVKQTGGGHTRYFVYDADHHLVERLDNNVATDFITIGSLPIARITGGVPTCIHADYQNTPLFETNSGGTITRTPDYLAYGQPVDAQGTAEIPGYTGAAPDTDTGLLYLGARYLRAPRFLSVDPVDLDPTSPMGLNRYAYANNNPARFTDPDGRCADGTCDIMVKNYGAWANANPEAADKLGSTIGAPAVGVMLTASGLGEAVVVVKTAMMVDRTLDSHAPPSTPKLTDGQAKNLARFEKKFSNDNRSVQVTPGKDGSVTMKNEVPGKVPGSKAVYEKTVDSAGKTTSANKTTYDPKGDVVHVKNKLNQ